MVSSSNLNQPYYCDAIFVQVFVQELAVQPRVVACSFTMVPQTAPYVHLSAPTLVDGGVGLQAANDATSDAVGRPLSDWSAAAGAGATGSFFRLDDPDHWAVVVKC